MIALDLLKSALTLMGKTMAVASTSAITGNTLMTEALSILGMDAADTSFSAQSLPSINRMLMDLFEINNCIRELNGAAVLSDYPAMSDITTTIPYQAELVRNVMTHGLARDIGIATDSVNVAYFAQMYDKQKAFYTLSPTGSIVKTVVPSINEMLVDLFGINNDLLVSTGGAALAAVPEIATLNDTLSYKPALLKSVMPYGLARDLAAGENDRNLMYFANMYTANRDKAAIFTPVDITDYYDDSDD